MFHRGSYHKGVDYNTFVVGCRFEEPVIVTGLGGFLLLQVEAGEWYQSVEISCLEMILVRKNVWEKSVSIGHRNVKRLWSCDNCEMVRGVEIPRQRAF